MYKKDLTYKNYEGQTRTKTLWFHLNQVELIDMEVGKGPKGILAYIEHIQATEDKAEAVKFIKELLQKSYGIKSEDGERFIKSDAIWEEFTQTAAYPTLFNTLMMSEVEMEAFMNGVIPADVNKQEPFRKEPSPVIAEERTAVVVSPPDQLQPRIYQ